MRKHTFWASATLALAIAAAAACGGSPSNAASSPSNTCVNAGAAHHAYVVVQHLSGTTVQKCVGFTGDTIDGKTLMDKSGVAYQSQTSSFGLEICAIDSEPRTFSECFPKNQPYWSLFVENSGAWAMAQTGISQVSLHDRDAVGWHYVSASDPSPAPPPLARES